MRIGEKVEVVSVYHHHRNTELYGTVTGISADKMNLYNTEQNAHYEIMLCNVIYIRRIEE